MIGKLPISGKEGGSHGEATEPGKYVTYKTYFNSKNIEFIT